MARNHELLKKRNIAIEKEYVRLCKKYQHYKEEYILRKLENKFYVMASTILIILSCKKNEN